MALSSSSAFIIIIINVVVATITSTLNSTVPSMLVMQVFNKGVGGRSISYGNFMEIAKQLQMNCNK